MKKWMIALILLAAIVLVFIYQLIPAATTVTTVIDLKANATAVARTLGAQQVWDKLAPGTYHVTERLQNGGKIAVSGSQDIQGQVMTVPIRDDSSALDWQLTFSPRTGLFSRFQNYNTARALKNQMQHTARQLKVYYEADSNTYGIHIINQSTTDTLLIATRFSSATYPQTEQIYSNVDRLRKFAATRNVSEVSSPMLNITLTDSNTYNCMVGLPINKIINATGDIFFVRMVPGRFLTAELHGGTSTVRFGHDMIREYIVDYRKLLMAMPFEHLITDRRATPDTTKWITTLYYPVP